MDQKILVVSSNEIVGYEQIEYLGVVQGSTVKSRNFISDLIASLKTIIASLKAVFSVLFIFILCLFLLLFRMQEFQMPLSQLKMFEI